MKSTFSVIYYLKRQVVKKDGTVPVMGRITVDGSQTQFSCKLTVDPKLWDTKGGRVTGRSSAALETNRMLDKMRVRINKHYQEIMERDNFVTAEKVKNAFLGLEHRYHTLMQVFRQHNEDYEKQVDAGMKAKGTLLKYRTVYKHLQEFLTIRYRVKDIALKELTPAFISDFEMFLRTDKHCCTNTVWLYVCPLRTMVFIAINNEWLTRDPFREYEIKKEETTRSFLTKDEIRLLMDGKYPAVFTQSPVLVDNPLGDVKQTDVGNDTRLLTADVDPLVVVEVGSDILLREIAHVSEGQAREGAEQVEVAV